MSNFVVNINEPKSPENQDANSETPQDLPPKDAAKKSGLSGMKIFGIALAGFLLLAGIGCFLYWQSVKKSPQYSLALLVDAARREDQKAIDELVDTDAVVDDFMPQITDKAIELYGRNMSPTAIQKVTQVAAPYLPAVKQRARAEVPNLIREKTKPFEKFPFWAIALGASRYLDIAVEAEKATVKSKIAEQPLELTMKRKGELWQVVGIRDEVLARQIAEKIGQEMITRAKKSNSDKTDVKSGDTEIKDLQKQLEGIFK